MIISVSIPPFRYFVESISGGDFEVNVMVPAGTDPHIYEPVPGQISSLKRSVAYISDGHLAFEMAWLERFYEANKTMKRLSLADHIDLIKPAHLHGEGLSEGADPHFWISPKCAAIMALSIKNLLCELRPVGKEKYEENYSKLMDTISEIDRKSVELLSGFKGRSFLTFHPSLGYFARDYSLKQIAVEKEGKEPTPSIMRELIDSVRFKNIKVILVQKEFDTKNAKAIASETGAILETIDPLSGNWPAAMMQIINALHSSFVISGK